MILGAGSSSRTNRGFQIQPLFRRWCGWEDPKGGCLASKPRPCLIWLPMLPGIRAKSSTSAVATTIFLPTSNTHAWCSPASAMIVRWNWCRLFTHHCNNPWCGHDCIPSLWGGRADGSWCHWNESLKQDRIDTWSNENVKPLISAESVPFAK